ncbi:phosphoribosyl-AMP cyclohydrolase [Leucothrix mucor]|uniref:phosphoribosyl-AMP cyclohydrolase n=1 Tax=Leucothrix mucor TaxID=45248 RepID=UPI0003B4E5E3|nr:phosphoribosyl-AMP cyclohydrolase [Leucothrix mucor]
MTDSTTQAAIPNDTFIEQFIAQLTFNEDGLIPAIAQQHDTGEVLMMAWMNSTSIAETLKNNRVCYWSRSRQSLWRKGESSGQVQLLKGFRIDCDADTLLLEVDQTGPACHTGRRSCFYRVVEGNELITDSEPLIDPKTLYGK